MREPHLLFGSLGEDPTPPSPQGHEGLTTYPQGLILWM